jgi:glycosyltransferase involved in cell wall biosynthesis
LKVFHIHHRSPHHAERSGYSRLSDFMEVQPVYGATGFPYRVAKFISSFHNQNKGIYNTHSVLKEWELFSEMKSKNTLPQVIHYLNAERDIRHIVKNKQYFSNTSFCGTFHKPPEVLKQTIRNTSYLQGLDGVIAVGINQVDFLKEWLQNENVQFIPHGVDTTFFKPTDKISKDKIILFVGQHLRDFDTFNKSIEVVIKKFANVRIDVILHKAYIKNIIPNAAIRVHSGLNDIELRSMYQEATLLFLPLHDVTACNSILEALSCGLPIITSDVGSNSEYLKGTENILVPRQDTEGCISAISEVLNDEDRRLKIGLSSRAKALEYDWGNITKEISSFYKQILIN